MAPEEKQARITTLEAEIRRLDHTITEKMNESVNNKSFEEWSAGFDKENRLRDKYDRELRMLVEPEFEPVSEFGHLMDIDTFIELANDGTLINYDGYGYYVRGEMESNIKVYPSDVSDGAIRKDFDKIIWFNK